MIAYLATSAFDHLYRKIDCTAADIGALRKAIYSRTVSIPLGLHNLEEIVLDRRGLAAGDGRAAPPAALDQQLARAAETCGQLLADDLRALPRARSRRVRFCAARCRTR